MHPDKGIAVAAIRSIIFGEAEFSGPDLSRQFQQRHGQFRFAAGIPGLRLDDRPDISQGLPNVYLKFKAGPCPLWNYTSIRWADTASAFGTVRWAVSSWQFRFYDWMIDMGFAPKAAAVK